MRTTVSDSRPSELALNSAGFTPLAFANASMVRGERLVPTEDPA